MNEVAVIVGLALVGSIFALIGGVFFLYVPGWSKFLSKYSVPFAAGVLLTASLVGILPEAVHMAGEDMYIWLLAAFLGSFLVEHFVVSLHHHDSHDHSHHSKGPVSLIIAGDTIHNFIDGVAIAASYLVNPGLGIITTVSTFLHEVPHEIGDFGILLKAGWEKKRILLVNALSASTTLVGAMLVVIYTPSSETLGILMAIAAGMFLYLGASDFLPHSGDGIGKNKALASLMLGTGIMLLVLNLVPHTHETSDVHHNHDEHEEHEHDEDEFFEMHSEEREHMNDHEDEGDEHAGEVRKVWEVESGGIERVEIHEEDDDHETEEIQGYL